MKKCMHINKTNVVCSKVKTESKHINIQDLMNFRFLA